MEEKPVIAIYDVRGIQDYIFRTNALKEIVGASLIVDNLIIDEFKNASKNFEPKEIILDWENAGELQFETNTSIKIEVLYYGGGNLVVLFRNEDICKKVSIEMSKNIIKNAYGLSLAYAYVEKTANYQSDWKNLKDELAKLKATTPLNKPVGVIPIVQYDNITGLPLSQEIEIDGRSKKITYEAWQKIKKYESIKDDGFMKEFDQMRTSKEEGLIAIVHIDGNSMGQNIGSIMKEANNYKEATRRMRKISNDIHNVFEKNAIDEVKEALPEICKSHGVEKLCTNKLPFRKIIQAGDDITFVCNERISLDITQVYINAIRKGYMYDEKYPFSACAGIAIIHSHFPFYKGYKIAEECCQTAKTRAKSEEGKVDEKIGNYVDFQYCYSGNIVELETLRETNYTNIEGKNLIKRPYGIFNENDKITENQKGYDIKNFENDLENIKNISRTTAKALRDEYYKTEANVNTMIKRLKMKDKNFKLDKAFENNTAKYYDALEFLDIYAKRGGTK